MANLEGILEAVKAARRGAFKLDMDLLMKRAAAQSPPKSKQPKLLSGIKEISAFLGISPSTYHNWKKRGLPVSSPPGSNRVFITERAALRWIGQAWDEER